MQRFVIMRSIYVLQAANGSPTKMESKLRVREHPDLGAFADGKMEIPISSAQEVWIGLRVRAFV